MRLLSYIKCKKSKLEIYLDVLRVIAHGTGKPTMMVYTANISRKLLSNMLENLEEWGLIKHKNTKGHPMFLITEKGKRVLDKLDTLPMRQENIEQEKIDTVRIPHQIVQ